MAENSPQAFGPAAAEQYKKIAREVMRRMMNDRPHRGRWQQYHGTGDGAKRIWFTIESVDCDPDGTKVLGVSATWFTGGCTQPIPGEDDYGLIDVEDICSILKPYSESQRLGGTGSATYMYPREGYCDPMWLVDDICVIPDCA